MSHTRAHTHTHTHTHTLDFLHLDGLTYPSTLIFFLLVTILNIMSIYDSITTTQPIWGVYHSN